MRLLIAYGRRFTHPPAQADRPGQRRRHADPGVRAGYDEDELDQTAEILGPRRLSLPTGRHRPRRKSENRSWRTAGCGPGARKCDVGIATARSLTALGRRAAWPTACHLCRAHRPPGFCGSHEVITTSRHKTWSHRRVTCEMPGIAAARYLREALPSGSGTRPCWLAVTRPEPASTSDPHAQGAAMVSPDCSGIRCSTVGPLVPDSRPHRPDNDREASARVDIAAIDRTAGCRQR
jgi:hypothetical protein